MILEILILLEVLAFAFLALSILPIKSSTSETDVSSPFMNRIIFVIVAAILFFALGMNSANYEYTFCFVNATTVNYVLNASNTSATCQQYILNSPDLAYINMGLGTISIVIMIILILLSIQFNKERKIRNIDE